MGYDNNNNNDDDNHIILIIIIRRCETCIRRVSSRAREGRDFPEDCVDLGPLAERQTPARLARPIYVCHRIERS
jgi:hypothetical protein